MPAAGAPAALGEPVELAAQDLPRGGDDRRAVVPGEVGGDQRGAGVPGGAAQGAGVAVHGKVAVAALPGGHRVALDGVEVDIDGEEVVAALRTVFEDGVEEVSGREPLALEPALHIGEGEDDSVDLPGVDEDPELLDGEWGRAVCHGVASCHCIRRS